MRGRGTKRGSNASEASSSRDTSAALDDTALVEAMRQGHEDAYREFFFRFAPLVIFLARLHRVPREERTMIVTEFLDDVALRLGRRTLPVPRLLAPYVTVAFRNQLRTSARAARARVKRDEEMTSEIGEGGERPILGAVSEHAARAVYGGALQNEQVDAALERLALLLDNELDPEERRIVTWLGRRVPQREMAGWLGVNHGALRVRISRLRARLRLIALAHVESLIEEERAQIEGFLRRAGVVMPEDARQEEKS
jgi:RNA polymerase sigma factor (sigma-70 family)